MDVQVNFDQDLSGAIHLPMMFEIELTRNGRPNILIKNHKYRESYTVKSGEIIWRCLGRTCGATVKTNEEKTSITVTQSKHSGPHPVPRRALSSPSVPSPNHVGATSTPSLTASPVPTAPATTPRRTGAATLSPAPVADVTPDDLHPTLNCPLMEQLQRLKNQLTCVLDHSIESDMRLIQYTDQVFVANTPLLDLPTRASVTRCSVQCDLRLVMQGSAIFPKTSNWGNKTRPNRKKKRRPRRAIKSYLPVNKTSLLFSSIHIEGDSHGRGLAALVRLMVDRKTAVSGVRKPGATLLDEVRFWPSRRHQCDVAFTG
ncbi:hypothetical protein J6590_017148 [Homalodisca vitripennis]|nr:hypothetical protein J6590_017148 [Homalodisca vitripennis]